MKWFTDKQKRLERMQGLRPTSKASLKMQCLMVCKGDIEESKKLYDYFAKDMPELPDFDPVPQTWQQSTAQTVNGIMDWVKENQGTLAQAYDFFQGIIKRRGPSEPIAPAIESQLPPINQPVINE